MPHAFSALATAAYCPRQCYYARREGDLATVPDGVEAVRELAFRYDELLPAADADLREAPLAVPPARFRRNLRRARARLDRFDELVDPPERDVYLRGRECHGVAHKVLPGDGGGADSGGADSGGAGGDDGGGCGLDGGVGGGGGDAGGGGGDGSAECVGGTADAAGADDRPPVPVLVSAGAPPEQGVYEPQSVRAVAAAKALAHERERPVERALYEFPAHGVVRPVPLTTRRRAAYRRTVRTLAAMDGPPPRVDDDAKCAACDYRAECGVRTRSLRSRLGL